MEKLKKEYEKRSRRVCELRFENCWYNNALGFAHRHKRRWYKSDPDKLWTYNQTLLVCNPCHEKMEYDSDLTEKMFQELRGKEK